MNELAYFMFWAGILFLMMRFGCGAHVMGHGRGKTVSTETAKPSVHDGHVYYFCSRDCRERFEAAPEQYLAGDDAKHPHAQPENEHV